MTSDLLMLQEFGESRTPPADQPPTDLRRRVLTAALAGRTRGRRTAVRPAGLRLAWRFGALGGVAAALAAATLLVVPNLHTAGNAPPGPQAAAPDAVRLLTLAAQHSAAAPELTARPDQFLFVESVNKGVYLPSGKPSVTIGPTLNQHWHSVDGTRDGSSRSRPIGSTAADWQPAEQMPGCRNGRFAPAQDRPTQTEPCTPWLAFRSGLPTDAAAMLAYLYRPGSDDQDIATTTDLPADQKAFARFTDVIDRSHHSPAVQAAAFQAAKTIPGVTVVRNAVDVAGRRGVAVARDANGLRIELIFDPATFAHLGTNYDHKLTNHDGVAADPGVVSVAIFLQRLAVLRVAIVDRAGQLP